MTYRRTYIGGNGIKDAHQRLRGTDAYDIAKMLTAANGHGDFVTLARKCLAAEQAAENAPKAEVNAVDAWKRLREQRDVPRSTPSSEGVNTYIAKLQNAYVGLTSAELRGRLVRLQEQSFSCSKRKRLALRTCRRALADAEARETHLQQRAASRWDMPAEPTVRRNARNANTFRSAFGAE